MGNREKEKRPLTVQEAGSMGGKARAEKLSKEELSRQGRSAVLARWKKKKKAREPTPS